MTIPNPSSIAAPFDEQEQLVRFCKASADNLRLQILRVLQQNAYAVQELCDILDIKQSSMSHHLKLLAQSGLVDSRREGNTLFYRRQPQANNLQLQALQNSLFEHIDQLSIDKKTQENLDSIRHRRSEQSLSFFTAHADKFRTQQDLIAEYPQYGDTVTSLLDSLHLKQHQTALEIGPGEGQFLPELSSRFAQVIAVDNNASMLQHAQRNVSNLNVDNIRWIHGDTRHLALKDTLADLIVLNMVLHHTPSPSDIFKDLRHYISEHGVLIITDLCRHDQDWAKSSCGDLWLGFDTEELITWANATGFAKQQTLYLSLLNGFRIQICLFTPNNA